MSEKPEAETSKPARGKDKKAPPAIDLTPAEVKEIVEGKPAESVEATSPVSETKADTHGADAPSAAPSDARGNTASSSAKLVPAVIGLVAGVIGGLGAYHFGDAILPRKAAPVDAGLTARLGALEQRLPAASAASPAALMARIEKAESLLAEAGKREDMLRVEIGKLGQALAAEVTERKKALEATASRAGQAVGLAGVHPGADIEGLKSRLGSIEDKAKALPEVIDRLGSELKAVAPRVETVAKDVASLSGRLAQLSAQEKLGAAQARLAAATLLEEAFAAGRPLGEPVRLLKNLGVAEGELAPFMPYLETPAPDAARLLADLRALKPKAAPEPGQPGFFERLKAGASSLVEVRKTGTVTGTDDAAHIQRAELALQKGDVGTAAALIVRLSAANAPVYAEWRANAERRAKAAEGVTLQKKAALAALAAAAAK